MTRTTGVNKACLGEGRFKVAHVPIMCPGKSEHARNSLKMLGKDWQRLASRYPHFVLLECFGISL
jgi:hypothetical protein